MIIRDEQMEAFDQAALKNFEDRTVAHLNTYFPKEVQTLGEKGTREIIREGHARAEKYGISSERDLCKFIDVMFTLGRQFDTDPRLPWAAQILIDPTLPIPSERVNRLVQATIEHSKTGGGHG